MLDLVLRAGSSVLPNYLVFLGHFWKGRARDPQGMAAQRQECDARRKDTQDLSQKSEAHSAKYFQPCGHVRGA